MVHLGLLNISIAQIQDNYLKSQNNPSAIVTDSIINFWFPVENADGEWIWNLAPEHAGEHSWIITFHIGEETYKLGYRHSSKYPPKVRGSLIDLLEDGITCIWKLGPVIKSIPDDGMAERIAKKITDKGLQTTKNGNGILISLTNQEWVSRIKSINPDTLEFYSAIPFESKTYSVPVIYIEKKDKE